MPTPSGVTIVAKLSDGTEVDVTEGVQVLYDLVVGSMDFGSGFLTEEDAVPLANIAEVCGFERSDEAFRYLREVRITEGLKQLNVELGHFHAVWPPLAPGQKIHPPDVVRRYYQSSQDEAGRRRALVVEKLTAEGRI